MLWHDDGANRGRRVNLLGDPCPELLTDVARVQPEPGGEWVHLGRLGFRSTQRLHISDVAGGVVVAAWPAELAPQARYEHDLWPWLKDSGFADDGDDPGLRRFLDEFLGRRPVHMRPGLRFRRVWTFAEASGLGSALAEMIRDEVNAVFGKAHEPTLTSAGIA